MKTIQGGGGGGESDRHPIWPPLKLHLLCKFTHRDIFLKKKNIENSFTLNYIFNLYRLNTSKQLHLVELYTV